MADETSPPANAGSGVRAAILVFAFVAVLLAAAIAVVAITQLGTAAASQSAATDVRLLHLELGRLQQDVQTSTRLLTELTTRAQADAAKVADALQALSAVDDRIQEEIRKAAAEQRAQAELGGVAQQQTTDTLARLTERIEALKTAVVPREALPNQDQIADTVRRIERAETDITALRQALKDAAIPDLKARVQDLNREVIRVEADLKALSAAAEAFRAQVAQFLQDVFYNDPWGKFTPPVHALPPDG